MAKKLMSRIMGSLLSVFLIVTTVSITPTFAEEETPTPTESTQETSEPISTPDSTPTASIENTITEISPEETFLIEFGLVKNEEKSTELGFSVYSIEGESALYFLGTMNEETGWFVMDDETPVWTLVMNEDGTPIQAEPTPETTDEPEEEITTYAGVNLFVEPSNAGCNDAVAYANGAMYCTLNAAASAAQDTDTITINENIALDHMVYVFEKHITIKGVNPNITISRGTSFAQNSDLGHGGPYNPSMFEIAVNPSLPANPNATEVRFEDIIITDSYRVATTATSRANVHEGLISMYGNAGREVSLVLGNNVKLQDAGGRSFIYAIDQGAHITMESGSVIEDTATPANMIIALGGTTAPTSGNNRGNAAIATSRGSIDIQQGATIQNIANMSVINAANNTIQIDGTIKGTRNTIGSNTTIRLWEAGNSVTVGITGLIQDNQNSNRGVISISSSSNVTVYGTIDGNSSGNDRGGAISTTDYCGAGSFITIKPSAKITNNTTSETGGAIYASGSIGAVTIEGGLFEGNKSGTKPDGSSNGSWNGGAIEIRKYDRSGSIQILGGTFKDNVSTGLGGAICFEEGRPTTIASGVVFQGNQQTVGGVLETNDVTITANRTSPNQSLHLEPGVSAALNEKKIYMGSNNRYVVQTATTSDLYLTNSNTTVLNTKATGLGLIVLSKVWVNTPEATMSFDHTMPTGYNAGLPTYFMYVPTDVNGTPLTGVEPVLRVATVGTNINVNFAMANANGYAVAIVQPLQNYGTVTLSTTVSTLNYNASATSYDIPYSAVLTLDTALITRLNADGFANATFTITSPTGVSTTYTSTGDLTGDALNTGTKEFTFTGWADATHGQNMTFTGNLPAASFTNGGTVQTSGVFIFEDLLGNQFAIPSNVVVTNMVGGPVTPVTPVTPQQPAVGRTCQDDGYPAGFVWNGTACVGYRSPNTGIK